MEVQSIHGVAVESPFLPARCRTVADLIEQLSKLPPSLRVSPWDGGVVVQWFNIGTPTEQAEIENADWVLDEEDNNDA